MYFHYTVSLVFINKYQLLQIITNFLNIPYYFKNGTFVYTIFVLIDRLGQISEDRT